MRLVLGWLWLGTLLHAVNAGAAPGTSHAAHLTAAKQEAVQRQTELARLNEQLKQQEVNNRRTEARLATQGDAIKELHRQLQAMGAEPVVTADKVTTAKSGTKSQESR